jgi:hypothetical protein
MYAFPNVHNPLTGTQESGMTLRDYFAARAIQSMINHESYEYSITHYEMSSRAAYSIADAMLKARDE